MQVFNLERNLHIGRTTAQHIIYERA
jgi:hypothetical protein